MTDILHEWHESKLSFALQLVDNYSRKNPIGMVNVSIERFKKPLRNLSGYYLFFNILDSSNIPGGKHKIVVDSDYYFNAEKEVEVKNHPENPIPDPNFPIEIVLEPAPHYPFPPGATLIRGTIFLDKNIVPNAEVILTEKSLKTKTTEKGEFMFYIRNNDLKDNEKVHIEAKYSDGKLSFAGTVETNVLEGQTSVIKKIELIKVN